MPSPVRSQTFASLLDAQARSAGAGPVPVAATRSSPAAHAMEAILEGAPDASMPPPPAETADALAQIYADEPVTAEAAMPLACDAETVTRELQLGPHLAARELERIRRNFALANHPDRVAPADRDLATRRMALANVLIDQALQGAKVPH